MGNKKRQYNSTFKNGIKLPLLLTLLDQLKVLRFGYRLSLIGIYEKYLPKERITNIIDKIRLVKSINRVYSDSDFFGYFSN